MSAWEGSNWQQHQEDLKEIANRVKIGTQILTPGSAATTKDEEESITPPVEVETPIGVIEAYDNDLDAATAKLIDSIDNLQGVIFDEIKKAADDHNHEEIELLIERLKSLSDIRNDAEEWL